VAPLKANIEGKPFPKPCPKVGMVEREGEGVRARRGKDQAYLFLTRLSIGEKEVEGEGDATRAKEGFFSGGAQCQKEKSQEAKRG